MNADIPREVAEALRRGTKFVELDALDGPNIYRATSVVEPDKPVGVQLLDAEEDALDLGTSATRDPGCSPHPSPVQPESLDRFPIAHG